MQSLRLPVISVEDVVRGSIDGMQDKSVRAAVEKVIAEFSLANEKFVKSIKEGTLHALQSSHFEISGFSNAEIVKIVYEDGMICRKGGRRYYDLLKSLPRYGECPLCGIGDVETLDHYLPKSRFPALCVSPANLIPACRDCNTEKREVLPRVPGDVTLHPYFDRVDHDQWLHARVVQECPPRLEFVVIPPIGWAPVLKERAGSHLRVFKLGKRYASHANRTMSSIRLILESQYECGQGVGVAEYLDGEARTRLLEKPNSYLGVTYQALAANPWFCDEGFKLFKI
ncbi:hypothetical protein [Rhodococcus sp. YH1]|uniref:hypothetical protein n=1 Tax=Rhodococcus sp. YH1 TaxID=89066 RepID=UPI0013871F34|nr:hypothetical protein [Rhodococcus sp. YH1]